MKNSINFQEPNVYFYDHYFSKHYYTSQYKTEQVLHSQLVKFNFRGTELNVSFIESKAKYPYFETVNTDTIWNERHTGITQILTREAYRVSFRYQPKTIAGLDPRYSMADAYHNDLFLVLAVNDLLLKGRTAIEIEKPLDKAPKLLPMLHCQTRKEPHP
jgi:hypothetical protein